MILAALGTTLFVASIFAIVWIPVYAMHRVAIWRNWYTQPLKPSRIGGWIVSLQEWLETKQKEIEARNAGF